MYLHPLWPQDKYISLANLSFLGEPFLKRENILKKRAYPNQINNTINFFNLKHSNAILNIQKDY